MLHPIIIPSRTQLPFTVFPITIFFVQLTINGEPKSLDNITTLSSLVDSLGLKPDRLAIELNLNIVPRTAWPTTQLNDGDKLEIVHFVGGG